MKKNKMLHLNMTADIVRAWDSGEPLTAECGYSRVMSEKKYEKEIRRRKPLCPDCNRLAMTDTAKAVGTVLPQRTSAEIRRSAAKQIWHPYLVSLWETWRDEGQEATDE